MSFNLPIFIGTLVLFLTIIAAASLGYTVAQLIKGFLPTDLFTLSVTVVLLAVIAILLYFLFGLIKDYTPPVVVRERAIEPTQAREKSLEEPFVRRRRLIQTEQLVDIEVQNRLIRMLSGDRAAADRLVDQAKQRYPNQSEDWYWLFVIGELERDHR